MSVTGKTKIDYKEKYKEEKKLQEYNDFINKNLKNLPIDFGCSTIDVPFTGLATGGLVDACAWRPSYGSEVSMTRKIPGSYLNGDAERQLMIDMAKKDLSRHLAGYLEQFIQFDMSNDFTDGTVTIEARLDPRDIH